MTWKEKRIVTILTTILLILTVAVVVAISYRYRADQAAKHQQELLEDSAPVIPQEDTLSDEEFVTLRTRNGSFAPTFALGEQGSWIWADQPDFPLDDTAVQEILAILNDPQPQQTLPMEGGREAYALNAPRAAASATRADGSVRTISIGKATTDGKSFYAMLDGDETTVYILPGRLFQLVSTPVFDMMDLPALPELSENNLTSIVIQGAAAANGAAPVLTLNAAHTGEGENITTTWTHAEQDVTENPLVRALLQDLEDLALTRCVDYRPSENAREICGLTSPAATLTITYGDAQDLQLTIGDRVADGTGRYLQVDDDPSIYFLSSAMLDPLMPLAVKGLTA